MPGSDGAGPSNATPSAPELAERNPIRRWARRIAADQTLILIAFGALIGTITAFGTIAFAETLHWVERLTRGSMSAGGDWLVIAIPVVGMGLTGLLVHLFAADARGHGVPQVMKAIIDKGGVIPLRVGVVKVFASICTVGSGGSSGTEGPIVQIGATAGSVVGQRFRVSRERMQTFLGCGAAAGIASIFNAPIAGVFFVMEILLRDFSLRTFTPVVVAAVFSTATTQAFMGENEAIFASGEAVQAYTFRAIELPSYMLLGVICGLVAVGFSRLLHAGEDLYSEVKLHPLVKPITGAILLGVVGIAFLHLTRALAAPGTPGADAGVPAFFGNGYDTIRWLISPGAFAATPDAAHPGGLPVILWFLILLAAMKAVATTITLASGGSGGVFAPSLFLGAATGAAIGVGLDRLGLIPEGGSPAAYALVGMAAVVAGGTHAPMTAILILYELTRDAYVILPIMLAAIIAVVVAQLLERDSLYTYRLRRQGVNVGRSLDLSLMRRLQAGRCELVPLPEPVYASDPVSKLVMLHAHWSVPDFVVMDQTTGAYLGMVTGADMRTALIDHEAIPLLLVAELLREVPSVRYDEPLDSVMSKFAAHDVASLAVMSPIDPTLPIGILTRGKAIAAYNRALAES